MPPRYTLGTGHILFFLPRLGWLGRRHADLTRELARRGYALAPRDPLPTDGGDYTPDAAAREATLADVARVEAWWQEPGDNEVRTNGTDFFACSVHTSMTDDEITYHLGAPSLAALGRALAAQQPQGEVQNG